MRRRSYTQLSLWRWFWAAFDISWGITILNIHFHRTLTASYITRGLPPSPPYNVLDSHRCLLSYITPQIKPDMCWNVLGNCLIIPWFHTSPHTQQPSPPRSPSNAIMNLGGVAFLPFFGGAKQNGFWSGGIIRAFRYPGRFVSSKRAPLTDRPGIFLLFFKNPT